jgi:4-hydroxy-tetrahydrodipicolinate synthase
MKKLLFTGSGVAIITPFTQDGIDFPKLEELINFQIRGNTDAIIICGTTGESSTMSQEEHKSAIKFAVDKTAGRVPVIAGTGSNNTKHSVELSKYAEDVGADGLLIVTPYYNKTTQKGLLEHYSYIAKSVKIPLIIYNVPSRTGLNVVPETVKILSTIENIVAVKEASGDISQIAAIASLCGDEMHIYSGNDDQVVPILSLGGKGVISVSANIIPREMHDMVFKYLEGNVKESMEIQLKMIQLLKALFVEVNPIPVKTAMNMLGYNVGKCRLPLTDMNENNTEFLKNALNNYGLKK